MGGLPKEVLKGADALKPNHRNPEDTYGRPALVNAHPNMTVGDFGAPAGWPAQSPSKATFTPGLPGEKSTKKKDATASKIATVQPGIRRP